MDSNQRYLSPYCLTRSRSFRSARHRQPWRAKPPFVMARQTSLDCEFDLSDDGVGGRRGRLEFDPKRAFPFGADTEGMRQARTFGAMHDHRFNRGPGGRQARPSGIPDTAACRGLALCRRTRSRDLARFSRGRLRSADLQRAEAAGEDGRVEPFRQQERAEAWGIFGRDTRPEKRNSDPRTADASSVVEARLSPRMRRMRKPRDALTHPAHLRTNCEFAAPSRQVCAQRSTSASPCHGRCP